jgi:hypothetical protein
MNPVEAANMESDRKRIEKCAGDPEFMKLGLCPVCVAKLPRCLCVRFAERAAAERLIIEQPKQKKWWRWFFMGAQ